MGTEKRQRRAVIGDTAYRSGRGVGNVDFDADHKQSVGGDSGVVVARDVRRARSGKFLRPGICCVHGHLRHRHTGGTNQERAQTGCCETPILLGAAAYSLGKGRPRVSGKGISFSRAIDSPDMHRRFSGHYPQRPCYGSPRQREALHQTASRRIDPNLNRPSHPPHFLNLCNTQNVAACYRRVVFLAAVATRDIEIAGFVVGLEPAYQPMQPHAIFPSHQQHVVRLRGFAKRPHIYDFAIANRRRHTRSARLKTHCAARRQDLAADRLERLRLQAVLNH